MSLSPDQISLLLKTDKEQKAKRAPRQKKDVTEPRDITVWYKLPHKLADFVREDGSPVTPHCENPDCSDPRPTSDRGRNVVAEVKGKMMCRFCFLAGWLSESGHERDN